MPSSLVELGGQSHAFIEAGRGGRPLMLVHGFTGCKEDFADELKPLADLGFHAVSVDLLGHGESAHIDDESEYGLDGFAASVVELSRHLGWESFDLLGHSMGGMVAQRLALQHPEVVGRLILMDTHHGGLTHIDAEIALMGQELARSDGLEVIQQILKMSADPLESPAYERLCAERPGYREWSESKMLGCSQFMYASMLGQFIDMEDRLESLRGLSMPCLVIVGEFDEPFVEPSQRIAEVIVGAELALISTAGHCPQFEATDLWREALYGFLLR